MSPKVLIPGLIISIGFVTAPPAASDEQPGELSTNPFARPAWVSEALVESANQQSNITRGRIDLRAILIAGEQSLVNVGGKIIAIGEEADGHVLLSITDDHAVFSAGEKIVRVSVHNETTDETRDETDATQ